MAVRDHQIIQLELLKIFQAVIFYWFYVNRFCLIIHFLKIKKFLQKWATEFTSDRPFSGFPKLLGKSLRFKLIKFSSFCDSMRRLYNNLLLAYNSYRHH